MLCLLNEGAVQAHRDIQADCNRRIEFCNAEKRGGK